MKIYKVKFGMSAGTIDNTWFVRARDFEGAAAKAVKTVKTASRFAEEYTSARDVISVELQGNEEN